MRRLLLLASSLALAVSACGDSSQPEAAPATTGEATSTSDPTTEEAATTVEEETTTEEAEPPPPRAPRGVPDSVADYRTWTKLNDAPIPPRTSDPHNGTKDVFASRERRENGRFPAGTIVVKEATRPGADFVGLIAIMRKERGADPAHNDWVFVEYTRDTARERFREIASGAVCWTCHAGALDSDYVFTP